MEPEEFNSIDFEQRLTNLKDTQDSIQAMSAWCLKHRPNHKKVVSSWLNVLKQVKVEHRLILFYLANDVIQYSKRKNYEFVDSWGTTLQRATTMVRDEKVKHKIIRIFKIWEQRGIYNDEFLADLHDLLSINPTKKQQPVESDDEHATILASNIRNCVRLEKSTDTSFKLLSKTPLCDTENIHTLKDRRHVEDVEQEIEEHSRRLENYIKSLNSEIKSRTILIALLEQTDAFYHNQRGEVKVVANAYRNFGNRIKTMKRKLDELCIKLPSPLPSPDINAPSPEPDNEYDLPDLDNKGFDHNFLQHQSNGFMGYKGKLPFDINDFKTESPNSDPQPIQVIGSSSSASTTDLNDFNIDEFFKSIMPEGSSYTPANVEPQPVPPVSDYSMSSSIYSELPLMNNYGQPPPQQQQQQQQQQPGPYNPYRAPPPIPQSQLNVYPTPQQRLPNNHYVRPTNPAFNRPYNSNVHNYHQPPPRYPNNNFNNHMPLAPPPVPPAFDGNLSDEYNPESWDMDMDATWNSTQDDSSFNQSMIETPVSPPNFERKGLNVDVIEYVDSNLNSGAGDVDHRPLRLPPNQMNELGRSLDVDHRNLISLTGSPGPKNTNDSGAPLPPIQPPNMWKGDTDFRQTPMSSGGDTDSTSSSNAIDLDYRIRSQSNQPLLEPPQLNKMNELLEFQEQMLDAKSSSSETHSIAPLKSPPKMPDFHFPPPPHQLKLGSTEKRKSPGSNKGTPTKGQNGSDNVESIDMEMSEDSDDLGDFDSQQNQDGSNNDESTTNVEDESVESKLDQLDKTSKNINETPQTTCHSNPFKPKIPLFNSPPPNFSRPLLMTPNFPPNRFWGGMQQQQQQQLQHSAPKLWEHQQNINPGCPPRLNIRPPNFTTTSDRDTDSHHSSDNESNVDNSTDSTELLVPPGTTGPPALTPLMADLISNPFSNNDNTLKSPLTPRRPNPFSQPPRMTTGPIDINDLAPHLNWQTKRTNLDSDITNLIGPNQNVAALTAPSGGSGVGLLPSPVFPPQQGMINFNAPMRGAIIAGVRGGPRGVVGTPYFRPRGIINNNVRGNFRNNFRGGNNRGSSGGRW